MGFEGAAAAAANVSNDVLNALSSEAIFNKVYGDSDDDLEIGVNGSSIFSKRRSLERTQDQLTRDLVRQQGRDI